MNEQKLTNSEILIALEIARVAKIRAIEITLKVAETRRKCEETRRELAEFKERYNTDFLNF